MRTVLEGVGVAIQGHEEDYLELAGEHELVAISDLFERSGAEVVNDFVAHDLEFEHMRSEEGRDKALQKYRATTGRRYPKAYRIKIITELEELSDDESEAYWIERRYQVGESDDVDE